ncbi:hypothetical protein K0M31_012056 [Melipona bicolor]|uniref:Uncharacterized protein n=1 Tax=Melipona bicolor TaxID=60889 RepID=A0AA40GAS3_9HYME|nr:hypothetical protein K0M31_012056 [Melipona bicolor]
MVAARSWQKDDRRARMEHRRKKRPRENAKDLRPVRNATRIHGKSDSRQGRSGLVTFLDDRAVSSTVSSIVTSNKRVRVSSVLENCKEEKVQEIKEMLKKSKSAIMEYVKVNATTRHHLDSNRAIGGNFGDSPETGTVNTHASHFCLTPGIVRVRTRG